MTKIVLEDLFKSCVFGKLELRMFKESASEAPKVSKVLDLALTNQ